MPTVRLESPYLEDDDALWLRGNLHTHTTRSDGKHEPQAMIDCFAGLGHNFLGFSDHDTLSDLGGLDPRGMVLLPGNEVCGGGQHLLDIGARTYVSADGERQAAIDSINAASGFPVLCHPNWLEHFNHYTFEDMLELTGYVGIEIFNGVVVQLPGNHLAVDKWDRLLAAGKKVWGFANDDAHAREQAGRGWNVVRVKRAAARDILKALRTGSFYASSGVVIETIRSSGPQLHIVSPNADAIAVFGNYGARLHIADGPEMLVDVSDLDADYIRVECYGRGDTAAWTQPFFIRNGRRETLRKKFEKLAGAAKPVLRALRSKRAPALSGRMDDPLWRKAEAGARFLRLGDGEKPPVKTEVRCIATADKVFFAMRCDEPRLDDLKIEIEVDGRPSLWTDDSVELFLDVEDKAARYFQVMANAAGRKWVGTIGMKGVVPPPVEIVTGRLTGAWCVEVAVPLAALGASAARGREWGFHVCRNRHTEPGCFVWSWVGNSNHQPQRYGKLAF